MINAAGKEACYVFDCLSGLAVDWYSDRMLGNFFKLACPYLYAADTVAYFVLLRNSHPPLAVKAIHSTAQVVLDLYRSNGRDYILPLKVLGRHTPTMYMLHAMAGDTLTPVTSSMVISEILATTPQPWLDGKITLNDTWSRSLREAQQASDALQENGPPENSAFRRRLIRMLVTRNSKVAGLCEKYFDLCDLVAISKRMVGTNQVHRYSQHIVDLIDFSKNDLSSARFEEVAARAPDLELSLFASRDREMEERAAAYGMAKVFSLVLTFDRLFADTDFIPAMRQMPAALARAYDYPVDIEFAVNFAAPDHYRINLLQCRPFQVRMTGAAAVAPPRDIAPESLLLRSAGPLIGEAIAGPIHRIIYVKPAIYQTLTTSERYSVAQLIGDIIRRAEQGTTMLIGPGRWGSKMPELGVPVTFRDVKNVAVLCELATMHENLTPDISLGTHFFNDIVEMGIVYLGVYPQPGHEGHCFNEALLLAQPNRLPALMPEANNRISAAIHLLEIKGDQPAILLHTDPLQQQAVVYQAALPDRPATS